MVHLRKAWRLSRTGNLGDMRLVEEPLPALGPGEVRVRIKAIGLNFADVFTTLGLYAAAPAKDVVPGLEFAGIVEEVGPLIPRSDEGSETASGSPDSTWVQGDKVMGVTKFGAYATHIVVPGAQLLAVPEGWTWAQGAACLVQGLTAAYALLNQGALRPGHTVLVSSAAGGCGQYALGIVHATGARAVANVGSPSKAEFLLQHFPQLSAQQIVVRKASAKEYEEQLERALAELSCSGFDIVMDAVSGDYFLPGYRKLAKGGRYVLYGAAAWTPQGDKPNWLRLAWQWLRRPVIEPLSLIGDNKAIMGFNLIYMFDRAEQLKALADRLLALDLPPPHVGAEFSFLDALDAVRKFQSGSTVGKVVLVIDSKTEATLRGFA